MEANSLFLTFIGTECVCVWRAFVCLCGVCVSDILTLFSVCAS